MNFIVLAFFDILQVVSGYLKYTAFFVPLTLFLSPFTGLYAPPWPPASMLFVFAVRREYRLAMSLVVSLLYSAQYLQQHYNAGVLLLLQSIGFNGLAVALIPLFFVTISSVLAVFFVEFFKLRRVGRRIMRGFGFLLVEKTPLRE